MNEPLPERAPADRSRMGCRTCKDRRKKCDETKPVCERCIRGGFECRGYDLTGQYRRASTHSAQPVERKTPKRSIQTRPPVVSAPLPAPQSSGPVAIMGTLLRPVPVALRSRQISKPTGSQSYSLYKEPWERFPKDHMLLPSDIAFLTPSITSLKMSVMRTLDAHHQSGEMVPRPLHIDVESFFEDHRLVELTERHGQLMMVMAFDPRAAIRDSKARMRLRAAASPALRIAILSLGALSAHFMDIKNSKVWLDQARFLHRAACDLLPVELSNPNIPDTLKLAAIMETMFFDLFLGRDFGMFHSLLELAAPYMISVSGSEIIDICAFRGTESAYLAKFSWYDIESSIMSGKPTICQYELRMPSGSDGPDLHDLQWHSGCPTLIAYYISRISNNRWDPEFREEAELIEFSLNSWRPPPTTPPMYLAVHECWRLVALIYFHQEVRKASALSSAIVDCLEQMIASASLVPVTEHIHHSLGMPYFLGATIALEVQQRSFFRTRLGTAWRMSLGVIEDVWATSDHSGYPANWREVMHLRHKLVLI